MLFFFMYGAAAYRLLQRKVLCSIPCDDGKNDAVYLADGIQTPIVLGYVRPRIYLPAGIHEGYRDYVIVHESTHIRRKDYIIKALAYFITCMHWFNPLVWCAYYFMAKDMEMACDEEAVLKIGIEKRKDYASALLELSVGNGKIFATPPAFGEGDIKARIQNIMHCQGTARRTAVMAAAVGIFLTGIFLTANEQDFTSATAKTSLKKNNEKILSAQQKKERRDIEHQNESHILTFEMVREAAAQKTLSQMDFRFYENGRKEGPNEYSATYDFNYNFSYQNDRYQMGTYYDADTERLIDIYITRSSDSQTCWIYTMDDEEGERYPNELEVFLRTKVSIDDWLTLELPEEYRIGDYSADMGYEGGGALIYPQVYHPKIDTFAPVEWQYAGFIGAVTDPQYAFVFENGKPDERYFPGTNHSIEEPVGVMDTIAAGLGWYTLMVHGFHDLYTAADLADLESAGTDIRSLESVSEYWYFYFVKEGEERAYYLSLSAKEFTKEEAISIARTVKIVEDEAALQRKNAIRQELDVYFGDFMNTMQESNARDYGRDEFASIDGYIAGKWLVSRREIYKKEHGGIRSVDLKEAELLQLKETEGRMEALVHVTYQYAWGNAKEDACAAGCLFRVVLEQTASSWQVTDLECCDCVEIMILKEQMQRQADDIADQYGFVDDYFMQMYKNTANE